MFSRVLAVAIALLATLALACGDSAPDDAAAPSPTVSVETPAAFPTAAPGPTVQAVLSGGALLEALRGGGYTLVFRHGITDQTQVDDLTAMFRDIREGGDRVPSDDCSIQRNLSQAGRDQARAVGLEIERLAIPYARVLASPFCRTRETAGFAFGRYSINTVLSLLTSADNSEAIAAATRQLLVIPPAAGTNAIVVTHVANITIVGLPTIGEGDCLVLQADGSAWKVIAQIKADDWKGMG